jgi:protein-disulfide isomerase
MENNTNDAKQKLSTPAAIILAGFLIMVGIIVSKIPSKPIEGIKDQKAAIIDSNVGSMKEVTEDEHILGDLSKAEVLIVEYSDTECPFCKNFHKSIHKEITKYGNKVAWVYRHFPLDSIHPKTRMEARATECVASIGGNDAFWKYIDIIFDKTPANNGLDAKQLPLFAEALGIDKVKFADCFAKTDMDAVVDAQYQDGLNVGVTGTPYTIIITKDGTKIPIRGADEQSLSSTLAGILQ